MGGHVARTGERRRAYKLLVRRPEGKRPLGRTTRTWQDNTINDRKIGWGVIDWIHLVQNRDQWRALVNTSTNFRVP
jgi:hypothetical protein